MPIIVDIIIIGVFSLAILALLRSWGIIGETKPKKEEK